MTRSVLVLNHFAVPRGHPGGTRHVELFSRLEGWRYLIVASELNHLTGEAQAAEPGFQPVRTMAYTSNGWRRILNWMSYAVTAFWVGVRQRRIDVVYGSSPHLLAALAAWAISAVRRVPFVLEVRDLWPRVLVDMGQLSETSLVYRVLTRLEMFLYARARRIVVMAEGARTDLVRRGVPAEKIVYIPNGADPEDFVPSASREVSSREVRLRQVHGHLHGCARTGQWARSPARRRRRGPRPSDRHRARRWRRGEVRVAGSCRRAGFGECQVPRPGAEGTRSPISCTPRTWASTSSPTSSFSGTGVSPNKVFDYMAAGLPVLTNCPGLVSDLVNDAACGVVTPPRAIAQGLRSLLEETGKSQGNAGNIWIRQHQSRSAMARRLEAALAEARMSW